jgi:hypothetical protein
MGWRFWNVKGFCARAGSGCTDWFKVEERKDSRFGQFDFVLLHFLAAGKSKVDVPSHCDRVSVAVQV